MEHAVVSEGMRAGAAGALAAGLLLAGVMADWLLRDGRPVRDEETGAVAERPPRLARRGLLLAVWTATAAAALFLARGSSHPGEVPPDPLLQAVSYAGYLAWYAAGLFLVGPLLRRRRGRRG